MISMHVTNLADIFIFTITLFESLLEFPKISLSIDFYLIHGLSQRDSGSCLCWRACKHRDGGSCKQGYHFRNLRHALHWTYTRWYLAENRDGFSLQVCRRHVIIQKCDSTVIIRLTSNFYTLWTTYSFGEGCINFVATIGSLDMSIDNWIDRKGGNSSLSRCMIEME